MARSTLDLLRIVDQIGGEEAGFKSLGKRYHELGRRLMLTILAGNAEFERDLIFQRTNEGRARALVCANDQRSVPGAEK